MQLMIASGMSAVTGSGPMAITVIANTPPDQSRTNQSAHEDRDEWEEPDAAVDAGPVGLGRNPSTEIGLKGVLGEGWKAFPEAETALADLTDHRRRAGRRTVFHGVPQSAHGFFR